MGFSKIDKVLVVAPLTVEWNAVTSKLNALMSGQTIQKLDKAKQMFEAAKNDQKIDVSTSKVKVGRSKKKVVFRIDLTKGFYGKNDVTLVEKWLDGTALQKAYNDVRTHVETNIVARSKTIDQYLEKVLASDDMMEATRELTRAQSAVTNLTAICSQADLKKQMSEAARARQATLAELELAHGTELKEIMKHCKEIPVRLSKMLDRANQHVDTLEQQADIANRQTGGNEDPQYTRNLKSLVDAYKQVTQDVRGQLRNAQVLSARADKLVKAVAESDALTNEIQEMHDDFLEGRKAVDDNIEDTMKSGRSGELGKRWEKLGITAEDNVKWVMTHWWNATRENGKIQKLLVEAQRKVEKAMRKFAG